MPFVTLQVFISLVSTIAANAGPTVMLVDILSASKLSATDTT